MSKGERCGDVPLQWHLTSFSFHLFSLPYHYSHVLYGDNTWIHGFWLFPENENLQFVKTIKQKHHWCALQRHIACIECFPCRNFIEDVSLLLTLQHAWIETVLGVWKSERHWAELCEEIEGREFRGLCPGPAEETLLEPDGVSGDLISCQGNAHYFLSNSPNKYISTALAMGNPASQFRSKKLATIEPFHALLFTFK